MLKLKEGSYSVWCLASITSLYIALLFRQSELRLSNSWLSNLFWRYKTKTFYCFLGESPIYKTPFRDLEAFSEKFIHSVFFVFRHKLKNYNKAPGLEIDLLLNAFLLPYLKNNSRLAITDITFALKCLCSIGSMFLKQELSAFIDSSFLFLQYFDP